MSFLEKWLQQGGRHPSQLGRNSIDADRWDFQRFEQMLREMKTFNAERRALCEVVEETGNGLWSDAFHAFNRVGPELVDPSQIQAKYLINRAVMEQAIDLPEYQRLKNWTEGDQVASASACITIRPDLEQLYDRTKTAQKIAEDLQKKQEELAQAQQEQRDLEEMIQEWQENQDDPDSPENQQQAQDFQQQQSLIEEQTRRLQEEAEQLAQGLEDEMGPLAPGIRANLAIAMGKAADQAEDAAAMGRMWGLDPGTLVRMPADQRMKLAKRMNNERFKRMADLFGPLERLMDSEQQRRVNYVPEEIYDVSMGKDLERVLPAVLGELMNPVRKLEFYSKYLEGKLPQYEMRGTEKVGKGGIVCCLDNSGSMSGDPELWGKAVALCLLHLAKKQKRKFYGIHFGSQREIMEFDFSTDYEIEKVLDFAEFFFCGGTNFVTPLSLALDRLRAEFDATGAVGSDVVFITDGICGVPESWKEEYLSEMKRIGGTTWGFSIGGRRKDQPLYDICRGQVVTIADILNSSKDLRKVFAALGR